MFAVGHSTLYRNATCAVFAHCDKKTYAYSCSRNCKIRDWFRDPLIIGIEAGGDVRRDYIEMFYDSNRRHSNLGCLSPEEFEERMALRKAG